MSFCGCIHRLHHAGFFFVFFLCYDGIHLIFYLTYHFKLELHAYTDYAKILCIEIWFINLLVHIHLRAMLSGLTKVIYHISLLATSSGLIVFDVSHQPSGYVKWFNLLWCTTSAFVLRIVVWLTLRYHISPRATYSGLTYLRYHSSLRARSRGF